MRDIIDNIRVYLEDAPSVDLSKPNSLEYFRDYVESFAEDKNEDRLNELLAQLNAELVVSKGETATRALFDSLENVFLSLDPEKKVTEAEAEWVMDKFEEMGENVDAVDTENAKLVEKWMETTYVREALAIIERSSDYRGRVINHTAQVRALLRDIFGSSAELWEAIPRDVQEAVRDLARRVEQKGQDLEREGVVNEVRRLLGNHGIVTPLLKGYDPADVQEFIAKFREDLPTTNVGVLRIVATLAFLYDETKDEEPMNESQRTTLDALRRLVIDDEGITDHFPLRNRGEARQFQNHIRDVHEPELSPEVAKGLFSYATNPYAVNRMSIELRAAVERLRGDLGRYEGTTPAIPDDAKRLPAALRRVREHDAYQRHHSVQTSVRGVYEELRREAANGLQKTFDELGLRYVMDLPEYEKLFASMDKFSGTPNPKVVAARAALEDVLAIYKKPPTAGETYTTEALSGLFNKPNPKPVTEEKPMNDNLSIGAAFEATLHNLVNGESTQDFIRKVVAETVSEIAPTPIEVTYNGNSNTLDLAHAKLETVLTRMKAVRNIMLTGPAGCGKTFLAKQVADGCGLPFATVSCSADMSSSTLLGWLLPVNSATFEYVESDFIRLYENGGVFLLDEMDAADPSILLVINQALANGRLSVPQRRGNTEVIRHKDFVCIAACNTFGRGANVMYAGRERLDEATLDRFRLGLIEMDYDADLEVRLVASEVLTWGRQVREKIEKAQLRRILSTRFLLDASALYHEAGATINEIENIYFTGWKEDERVSVAVENRRPSEWF